MSQVLQSFIGGQWIGQQGAQNLRSAINGQALYQTHAEAIDFGDAVHYARTVGLPNLLKLDFQERAQRLKALAKYLGEHKEQLYAISAHTGATRADSWIDIEGGNATLFAYAGIGSRELPSGNLLHEGPAIPLGKQGTFAGSHILVVAARRDLRLLIRESVKSMGLVVDFVSSVTEATQFCREALPHAIVFESNLRGQRFDHLVAGIRKEVPEFVVIEVLEEGHAFDISTVSATGMARVGREALLQSLPSALVYELSRTM